MSKDTLNEVKDGRINQKVLNEVKGNDMNQTTLNEVKEEYLNVKAPEHGLPQMQKRIEDAKRDKQIHKRQKRVRYFSTAAVAALVLFLMNMSLARKFKCH